ncbi:TadE/TadG family type IV pilus assembly protein [Sphingomonas edaphi]|nr:TadE/TadG family type IV pilus assembly protein [Sphingomonas edaphi]
MKMLARIREDARGAAVIEMAFALPAFIVMVWMIVQLGLVFRAMSGIQHALGEGARLATIYPAPTNTQIETKITDAVYGIGPGEFDIPPPAEGTDTNGNRYVDLRVTYTQPTDLLLLPGPTISVTRSKRVWRAD